MDTCKGVTFCHTKFSSKWASPNGLSVLVYPCKKKEIINIVIYSRCTCTTYIYMKVKKSLTWILFWPVTCTMYCVGAYKVAGAGQCSSMRGKVSMATLWAAPTKHHHTEQFSGILTDQYLPSPYLKREQGMGKTKAQKGTQIASYCNNTLRRIASKQLRIFISHEVPLLEALGHPQYSWKDCWPGLLWG